MSIGITTATTIGAAAVASSTTTAAPPVWALVIVLLVLTYIFVMCLYMIWDMEIGWRVRGLIEKIKNRRLK